MVALARRTAVGDRAGVIPGVEVTTGETNEGETVEAQVDELIATTGAEIGVVTADAGYAYAKVYGGLERRGIDPLIPPRAEPIKSRDPPRRYSTIRCMFSA